MKIAFAKLAFLLFAVLATIIHFLNHSTKDLFHNYLNAFQVFSKNYVDILMEPLFQHHFCD